LHARHPKRKARRQSSRKTPVSLKRHPFHLLVFTTPPYTPREKRQQLSPNIIDTRAGVGHIRGNKENDMSSIDGVNSVLKAMGSAHRVEAGDRVDESVAAVIAALPAYVESVVATAIERHEAEKADNRALFLATIRTTPDNA
jgi:hypothetical protein